MAELSQGAAEALEAQSNLGTQPPLSASEDFINRVGQTAATTFSPLGETLAREGNRPDLQQYFQQQRAELTGPSAVFPTNPELDNSVQAGVAQAIGSAAPRAALLAATGPLSGFAALTGETLGTNATLLPEQQAEWDRAAANLQAQGLPIDQLGPRPSLGVANAKGIASNLLFAAGGPALARLGAPIVAAAPTGLRTLTGIGTNALANTLGDAAIRTAENAYEGKPLAPYTSPQDAAAAITTNTIFGLHGGIEQASRVPAFLKARAEAKAKADAAAAEAAKPKVVTPATPPPDNIEVKPATEDSTGVAIEPTKVAPPLVPTAVQSPESTLLPNAAQQVASTSTKEAKVVETPKLEAQPEEAKEEPGTQTEPIEQPIPENKQTLVEQQNQLKAGLRPAMLFTPGEEVLPLPEGFESVKTKSGTYHFDPKRLTAEQVKALDEQGAQNIILNLGRETKDDVYKSGQPAVIVTERRPDGTEVRAAVSSQGEAPNTAAGFEGNKTPGSTIQIEHPADVLTKRLAPVDPETRIAQIDAQMKDMEDSVLGDTSELTAQEKKVYDQLSKERQKLVTGEEPLPEQGISGRERPKAEEAPPPFTEEAEPKATETRTEPQLAEDLTKLTDDQLAEAENAAKGNPDALKLIDEESARRAERASLEEGTTGEERLPGDEVDVAQEQGPGETVKGDEGTTSELGKEPVPGLTPEESAELDSLWAKRKLTDKDEARIDELQAKIPAPHIANAREGAEKSPAALVIRRGDASGIDVINRIRQSSSPFADLVGHLADRYKAVLQALKFIHDSDANEAYYDEDSHTVVLGEKYLDDYTISHELVHAVTHVALGNALREVGTDPTSKGQAYLDGLRKAQSNPKTAQPVRDLIGQYFHALQTLKAEEKVGGEKGLANRPHDYREGETEVNYGLLNLSEFLSEAFTNKKFQDLINTIKDPRGGTVWSRIVDAVTRILGVKPHDKALLSAVLKTGGEIGDLQSQEAYRTSGINERVPAPREEDKPYIDRGQPENKPLEPGMETKDNGLVPSKEIEPTKEGPIGEAPNRAARVFAPKAEVGQTAQSEKQSFIDRAVDKLKSIPAVGRLAERLKPAVRDLRQSIESKFRGLEFDKTEAATAVRNGIKIAFHGNKEDMAAAYPLLEAGASRIGDPDGPTAQDVRLEVQRELDNGRKALASDQIPEATKDVIRKFLPHYERALEKFDELVPGTKRVKEAFDASYALRAKYDPDARYTNDYVSRVYELNKLRGDSPLPPESLIGGGKSGITSFDKSRKYDTIMDAMIGRKTENGWESETPKSFDVSDLAANHERITQDIVGNKILNDEFETTSYPETHEPLFVPKPTNDQPLPLNYVRIQGPFGKDAYVYKPVADLFKSIWGESQLRQSDVGQIALKVSGAVKHLTLALDTFHLSRVAQKAFMEAVASGDWQKVKDFRKNMPSYSEQGQMGKYLATLDLNPRDIDAALKEKVITPEDAAYMRGEGAKLKARASDGGLLAGRFSDNLWKEAEPFMKQAMDKIGAGKVFDGLKSFNKFTFDRVTKAAMFSAFESRLKRIDKDFPELTERQRSIKAAKEVNEQFGNIGRGGLLKSKTAQDYAQLFMLAPNWVQSQVMAEARQYGQGARAVFDATVGKKLPNGERERVLRFGNSARFLGTTALTVFAANQAINLATRGKPTWQNEEKDHKFDAWIPDVTGKSKGFFYSPIALASEYASHLKNYGKYESFPSSVAHIASNKLSPLASAAKVALTQKDYTGKKLSPGETVVAAARQAVPVPILASSALKGIDSTQKSGTTQQNLLKSAGFSLDRAPDAVAQAYEAFQPYRGKERPDTGPSPYKPLKTLIQNGESPERIKKEVDKLVKDGKKVQDIKKAFDFKPFSGSIAGDLRGLKEGGEDVKKVYDLARKQKLEERQALYRALNTK